MSIPLISVVMPVYDAGEYLIDAVASIMEQTLDDWELIAVDDGSQDGSGEILEWFARQDTRIRVIHQANAGIVAALNRGCAAARGPLIARMDADDVAFPQRLARQAEFMRQHPECVVVGSSILEMDAESDPLGRSWLSTEHAAILDNLLNRRTGHFHPTTMYRAEAFEATGGYRTQYQWIEDHDLWLRMAQRGELANLSETLLCYRQHATSVCWSRACEQRRLMDQLLREAYRSRGREVPAGLLASGDGSRQSAGPGKWARAAAKGGYPSSVLKQLRRLLDSDAPGGYKSRMILECGLRLPLGRLRRAFTSGPMQPPRFDSWHRQWRHEPNASLYVA